MGKIVSSASVDTSGPDWEHYVVIVDFYDESEVDPQPRLGFLLGPYDTLEEARQHIEKGKRLAHAVVPGAALYDYDVASLPVGTGRATCFGS